MKEKFWEFLYVVWIVLFIIYLFVLHEFLWDDPSLSFSSEQAEALSLFVYIGAIVSGILVPAELGKIEDLVNEKNLNIENIQNYKKLTKKTIFDLEDKISDLQKKNNKMKDENKLLADKNSEREQDIERILKYIKNLRKVVPKKNFKKNRNGRHRRKQY